MEPVGFLGPATQVNRSECRRSRIAHVEDEGPLSRRCVCHEGDRRGALGIDRDTVDVDPVPLETLADELAEGVISHDRAERGRDAEPRGGAREDPGCAARERTDHLGGLVEWGVADRPHEFGKHFTDHEERRHARSHLIERSNAHHSIVYSGSTGRSRSPNRRSSQARTRRDAPRRSASVAGQVHV